MFRPISCLVLLDNKLDSERRLGAALKRYPELADGWECKVETPSRVKVKQLLAGFEVEGLDAAIAAHRLALRLTLKVIPKGADRRPWHALELPGRAGPDCGVDVLGPLRALGMFTWVFVEQGGLAVAFLDGRRAWLVDDGVRALDPRELGPGHSQIYTCWHPAGQDRSGRTWVRTHGLVYAGLPDLSCTVATLEDPDERDGADTLFCSMAPYTIEMGRPLEPGETLELEHRCWEVVALPPESPLQLPAEAIRHHVRCTKARVAELQRARKRRSGQP